jgi:hypothetical protein
MWTLFASQSLYLVVWVGLNQIDLSYGVSLGFMRKQAKFEPFWRLIH